MVSEQIWLDVIRSLYGWTSTVTRTFDPDVVLELVGSNRVP